MSAASIAVEIFCSYADADEALWKKLEAHLSPLKQQDFVSLWHRQLIYGGTDWARSIDHHLETASIILLLVSANFFASDYCCLEMKRALDRHKVGEARVIPIRLRPVELQGTPLVKLQTVPRGDKFVTEWADRNLAFKDISMHLRKIVSDLQRSQQDIIARQETVSSHVLQAPSQFRRLQKRVSELKSIHHLLHEVESQLDVLSATIQLFTRGRKSLHLPDFDYIEILWRQAVRKIDNLTYFAAEEMEILEDERFSVESDVVKGASWVKDIFILQQSLDEGIKGRNIDFVKNLSSELLQKCRSHLYRIDKRLLNAIKELEPVLFPDLFTR